MTPVRVLIVDDSALVRELLSRGLNSDPEIQVVGTASDPYEARDKIVQLRPQVMTLDVEMPRMNGIEFLRKLMPQFPLPVVMVSSLTERGATTTFDALAAGAVDFVCKPKGSLGFGLEEVLAELRAKVKAASTARIVTRSPLPRETLASPASTARGIIAIGASTGGTEALASIFAALPDGLPPIVVVQHMPAGFTALFASRLDKTSRFHVREATGNELLAPGTALIAPGAHHLRVKKVGAELRSHVEVGPARSGHCPSVDVLFESVAELGVPALGVILTGMGGDGAEGLFKMRERGAATIGQDEASCVVYGMPRVAHERGAVERVANLDAIPREIINALQKRK